MAFDAIAFLGGHLLKEHVLFEWGSGGSTLYFSRRVNKVTSVEHDETFFHVVDRALRNKNITNVDYLCIPGIGLEEHAALRKSTSEICTSTNAEWRGYDFVEYVRHIDRFPDSSLDAVVVDGRARPSCIAHATPKLKPGAMLIVDNSNRPQYLPALKSLTGWQIRHFWGPVMGDYVFSRTSIYFRPLRSGVGNAGKS